MRSEVVVGCFVVSFGDFLGPFKVVAIAIAAMTLLVFLTFRSFVFGILHGLFIVFKCFSVLFLCLSLQQNRIFSQQYASRSGIPA